ncbi:MAG: prepilin-type N-terminal cleavage/methylation domain-containing protein [Planctomycetes bacterium]|nr:prepilin-type N-terminal cleavage/methylation domain-containing protein [Planctomycetota bacterium]
MDRRNISSSRTQRRFGAPARARAGFTLLEFVLAISVLSILAAGTVSVLSGVQEAFIENQILCQLRLRAQNAMERITALASLAVTDDPEFSPLKDSSGVASHALRFQLLTGVDASGLPIYDTALKVYIHGPDNSTEPCAGIIIGRGPTLTDVYNTGKGLDNVLGTIDDNTSSGFTAGVPAVELLITSQFAPQSGAMFTVDVSPAPIGRLLTFTIRLNARDREGNVVLPQDFVMSERVALRQ